MIDTVSSSFMSPWCFMSPISFCLNQDPKKRIVRTWMQVLFQHGSWFQGVRLSAVQYSCEKEAPTTPVLFTSNSQLGIARLPQEKAFFATQLVFSLRKSEWLLTKNSRWVQRAMVCSKLHCSTVARMQKHFPICPVMNFFKATKVYIKFTQILWSHEADSCAHPSEARIRTCLQKWSKCLWDFAACRASKSDGCAEWPWWCQTWGRIYRNIGAHLMH